MTPHISRSILNTFPHIFQTGIGNGRYCLILVTVIAASCYRQKSCYESCKEEWHWWKGDKVPVWQTEVQSVSFNLIHFSFKLKTVHCIKLNWFPFEGSLIRGWQNGHFNLKNFGETNILTCWSKCKVSFQNQKLWSHSEVKNKLLNINIINTIKTNNRLF